MSELDGLQPHRYVVTGGPSAGKHKVFVHLRELGLPCTEGKPAREIYRQFKERLGRHLQTLDRPEYSAEVLKAFIAEYRNHGDGLRFYDRGIPDGLGWDRFYGTELSADLEQATRAYRYDGVFVLNPLDPFADEADVVGEEREIRRIHELIVEGYYDAGYDPIFVPADLAEIRVRTILANVSEESTRAELASG
jgi:predicted ATPase